MSQNSIKCRGWCGTYHKPRSAYIEFLAQLLETTPSLTYIVVGKEKGEAGKTPHLQAFFYFKNQRGLKSLKDLLQKRSWHLEAMKGTPEQAAAYCKKEGDYFEHGVLPMSQADKGKKGEQFWVDVLSNARSGQFDAIPAKIMMTHFRAVDYHYQQQVLHMQLAEIDSGLNEWHFGPTGCGKSRYVRATFPDAVQKAVNKWWDQWKLNPTMPVIFDDVSPEDFQRTTSGFKVASDRYPFSAEIKGGTITIRPSRILVTSNYTPEMCFGPRDIDPILRRFRVVEWYERNGAWWMRTSYQGHEESDVRAPTPTDAPAPAVTPMRRLTFNVPGAPAREVTSVPPTPPGSDDEDEGETLGSEDSSEDDDDSSDDEDWGSTGTVPMGKEVIDLTEDDPPAATPAPTNHRKRVRQGDELDV